VAREMEVLRAQADRMFAGRDHLHTAVYRFRSEHRVAGGVSAATALDHPFAGVVAIAVAADDGSQVVAAIAGPEVPVVALFTPERVILAETEPPPFDLVLGFTVDDPVDAWNARVAPVLPSLPGIGFASPFLRTIPGTDAYVDDL
jgi:hypothetical protein